jgi:taurine dioxygenase
MSDTLSIDIRPSGAPVGAVVTGIDLSQPIPDAVFARIQAAYERYGVLVFRGQSLREPELIAFTARFGPLYTYPFNDYAHRDHPEMLILSNIRDAAGNYIGLADAGSTWHSDNSYMAEPPRGSVLHAIELPVADDGTILGNTLFSSAAAAYDDLPETLKRRFAGRTTTHSYEGKQRLRMKEGKYKRKPLDADILARVPPVDHPVVRTHEQTGRKCIYVVAGECFGISGLPDDEAAGILDDLAERVTRPEYVYRHEWQPGDVLMWDNCLVQHLAIQDYALPQRRLMWRTTISGAVPV